MAPIDADKDGQSWRIGTADDVAWIAGHTIDGLTVTAAIPPRFGAGGMSSSKPARSKH